MSLRDESSSPTDPASSFDPANQSLSDAIRITFRILQGAMILLAVAYALSGLKSVKEGQQGISLLFGKIRQAKLDPGFHLSAPFPLGELVRIQTSGPDTAVAIDDVFWVDVPAGTPRDTPIEKLNPTTSIKPAEKSGSVLTADGSIAHVRVKAFYRRADPSVFAKNILTDSESQLVRSAIQRGVVLACAQSTIDEVLRQAGGDSSSVGAKARSYAQEFLTRIGSGIEIDSFVFENAIAPLSIRADFANAQTAVAKRTKAIEEAQSEARRSLNAAAGEAAEPLIELIDQYELAIARQDAAAQKTYLDAINSVLDGKPVEMNGKRFDKPATGTVARLMQEANQYRSEVVSKRKAETALFNAKLAQFESNPLVMVHNEWKEAVAQFLARESVQVMLVPPGTSTLQLVLNADPDILKRQEQYKREVEGIKSRIEREKEMERARFETKTNIQTAPS